MAGENITVDGIRKAAATLRRRRPVYAELIGFYESVFVAQHRQLAQLRLPSAGRSRDFFYQKQENGFPLMDPSAFRIDRDAARFLLNEIVRLAAGIEAPFSVGARNLQGRMQKNELDVDTLLAKSKSSDDGYLQDAAAQSGIAKSQLVLFLYHSIRPSLIKGAEAVSVALDRGLIQGRGYCPVCGTPAVLSVLDFDGRRSLICGYCWYSWQSKRIFCPFCERGASGETEYLAIHDEPEYRIDGCTRCRTYIKTVDERRMDRPLYPALEAVCTLHLDMKAQNVNYVAALSQVDAAVRP